MAEQTVGGVFSYDMNALKDIPRLMRSIERRGEKVDPALQKWGTYMLMVTGQTFDRGGRAGVRWPPLKQSTLDWRRRRKRGSSRTGPRKILRDTGQLANSIRTVTFNYKDSRAQAVFTKVPYAPIHQEGGKAKFFGHTVTIPQRKFLFITATDRRKGLELMQEHNKKVVEEFKRMRKGL